MSKSYFGFAISDSMFSGDVTLHRCKVSPDMAIAYVKRGDVISCLNPSHKATIDAAVSIGLEVEIPETPPRVSLVPGDEIMVMSVRGLPRLTDRHEYTPDEISKAKFEFAFWTCEAMDTLPLLDW